MSARKGGGLATIGLLSVTAIWGSTFVLIKDVVGRMAVVDFLAVRFLLAAIVMLVLFARPVWRLGRAERRRGLALGVLYGFAQWLQTEGLALTSPSVSGFVTGMYVVLTPILALVLFRQRMPLSTWLAVVLATAGLGVLALNGFQIDIGVLLTLASAALYALHIVGLGHWSKPGDAFGMSAVQMVGIAAVCLLATLPHHSPSLPPDGKAWIAVLYMALVAGAFAMLVQTWAQAHMPATRAAIVMTTEPVFAAGFAVLLGVDALTTRMVVGGTMVLAAMYLVELAPRFRRRRPAEALHHDVG
ncbi:MAG: DMT family transporter [Luteibacter sp.]|jgi:drug/metabolite transporter (DMT)-like permease|uniref:DMT family transporter n=1 Tax=Luteibacter sp. TaxID=1886636 RepID=UPI0028088B20|nr:DMT family transporter [Luteibacter sp.]MDQ7997505.1 DMT family transporter [Luteibacter sp.]MDQ8050031.1 DMT family transporter [Luteibacter sp.]